MKKETYIERKKGAKTYGKTDYERLKKLTEEDIEKNARNDPDAPLLSEEELNEFKHVNMDPEEK